MAELTYARVNGPPADWNKVEVCFDGKWCVGWLEVDVAEGKGTRFAHDKSGRETVSGEFRLRYGSNEN